MHKFQNRNDLVYPSTDWTAIERLVVINALVNAKRSTNKENRGTLDHIDRFTEMLSRETAAVLERNRAKMMEPIPESVRDSLPAYEKTLHFLFAH